MEVTLKLRTVVWIFITLLISAALSAQNPSTTEITKRAIATLHIPGEARFLVADGKSVWVTNDGRIEKLEPDQLKPTATVSIPSPCGAMAVGFGSVWVANCKDGSIYRIDQHSYLVMAVLPTGLADSEGELSIAIGADSVWILSDSKGILSRIDPRTNKVIATITVKPYSYAAVFEFDSVWVTNTGPQNGDKQGSVQRIAPETNEVIATIQVGPAPRFLAAGEGGVWTLNQGDGSVTRIDPNVNEVVATIPVGVEGSGGDIATGAGKVWVRATKVLLSVIDPRTNRIMERFGPPAGSGAVRVADRFVWVSAPDVQTLWILRQ